MAIRYRAAPAGTASACGAGATPAKPPEHPWGGQRFATVIQGGKGDFTAVASFLLLSASI